MLWAYLDVSLEGVSHGDWRGLARAISMAAIDAVNVHAGLKVCYPRQQTAIFGYKSLILV